MLRFSALYAILLAWALAASAQAHRPIVADSLTRTPLSGASVFDSKGAYIGATRADGRITCASASDYPITIRCIGFAEQTATNAEADTIFLGETISLLPEMVVETKDKTILHILAYVRDYSTLSSYTDTVTMYREKMVDFMIPNDEKSKFKGWKFPRVINSRSYYRFTDVYGLDSVSDRCNNYFSWSDWVTLPPDAKINPLIAKAETANDTIGRSYSPSEIWAKNGERLTINVNVMADSAQRRWIPGFESFFRKDDTEFEQLRMRLSYSGDQDGYLTPLCLTGLSISIESRGRGRGMFKFNRYDQPFFVSTYSEVYILDKEFITMKEAKKWDSRKFDSENIDILEPMEAPALQPSTLALIDRVNRIDADEVRLSIEPDNSPLLASKTRKRRFGIGYRALSMLKQLTGITLYKSHKKFNDNWNKVHKDWEKRNKEQEKEKKTTEVFEPARREQRDCSVGVSGSTTPML